MIQCRALTALNTLTPIMSITDLGDKSNLVMVWNSLFIMASDKEPGTTYIIVQSVLMYYYLQYKVTMNI